MFYLASYALMNVGAFMVISHIAARNERFRGKSKISPASVNAQPVLAALFALFCLLTDRSAADWRLLRQVLCLPGPRCIPTSCG